MFNLVYAMAPPQPSGGGTASTPNILSLFFPFLLMLGIFYFLLILPQNKKRKEHLTMIDSLKKGDRVITSSGIYGVVIGTKENSLVLKISENTKIEIIKNAISAKLKENEVPKDLDVSLNQ